MFYGVILALHEAVPASTFPVQQPSILYDLKSCNSSAVRLKEEVWHFISHRGPGQDSLLFAENLCYYLGTSVVQQCESKSFCRPLPGPACRGWWLSHVWGQPSSLGCGCAVRRHSCPHLLITTHILFPHPCSSAWLCQGRSVCPFSSRLSQTHQPWAL